MINRELQPKFKTSSSLDINCVDKQRLSNGIPLFIINAGNQDVVKVDFLFKAGTVFNPNPLIPDSANALLEAGTKNKTSVEIAESLDFYGTFLELNIGKHTSQIILYTLNKYFEETLEIVTEIIFNANFPEHEIDTYIKNRYQRFLINRQKTSVVSQEILFESVFGFSHPYGRITKEEDFKQINKQNLTRFYNKNYSLNDLNIILSGKVEDNHIHILNKKFGQKAIKKTNSLKIYEKSNPSAEKKIFFKINDVLQSSIKIGKETISRTHPDFFNLNITSIILGGYFGSRLMKNIREDKGYTYGIYAGISSLLNAGIFYISAEAGKNIYKKAVNEIYKELKTLRTTFVSKEELERVKNYLTGNLSKTFDGAFSVSDAFKSVLFYDFDLNYYNRYFKAMKNITPDTIREISGKYLHEDSMFEIIVGAK